MRCNTRQDHAGRRLRKRPTRGGGGGAPRECVILNTGSIGITTLSHVLNLQKATKYQIPPEKVLLLCGPFFWGGGESLGAQTWCTGRMIEEAGNHKADTNPPTPTAHTSALLSVPIKNYDSYPNATSSRTFSSPALRACHPANTYNATS